MQRHRPIDHPDTRLPLMTPSDRPPNPADEFLAEPCHKCRYDLRMTAIGGRCPECGTQKLEVATSPLHHFQREAAAARESLEDGWKLWGRTLLASPLIFFAQFGTCLGPVFLVAFAFVAPFRIFALRRMLPTQPYEGRLPEMERDIARAKALATIECAIAVLVVIVAILQSLPTPILDGWVYRGLAVVVALWQCVTLLHADRIARTTPPLLVEASRLPKTSRQWIITPCLLSATLYLIAAGCITSALLQQQDAWFAIAWLCWSAASISLCIAAVFSRAHAVLVCDCLFEAQMFQARGRPGSFFQLTEDGGSIRHASTPKQPEDDTPIPLAE